MPATPPSIEHPSDGKGKGGQTSNTSTARLRGVSYHILWLRTRVEETERRLAISEHYGGITSAAVSTIRRNIREGRYPLAEPAEEMVRKLTRLKINI